MNKKNGYSATLFKVDGQKQEIFIEFKNSLETLQKLVEGYIQVIQIIPFLDYIKGDFSKGNDLIINEEGKLLDLPINPWSQFAALNSIWEAEEFRGDIVLINGRLR